MHARQKGHIHKSHFFRQYRKSILVDDIAPVVHATARYSPMLELKYNGFLIVYASYMLIELMNCHYFSPANLPTLLPKFIKYGNW